MTLRSELEMALLNAAQVSALSEKFGPSGFNEKMGETACGFLRDYGPALLEAVVDAERYRWLRQHSYVEFHCDIPRVDDWTPAKFDTGLDKARGDA